jgi:hypothetical protein
LIGIHAIVELCGGEAVGFKSLSHQYIQVAFGSNNWPGPMALPLDVSGYTPLELRFLHGTRSNIVLVSIPPAISIQFQVRIVLIKLSQNPLSYHKPSESSSLISCNLCHVSNQGSIEFASFLHLVHFPSFLFHSIPLAWFDS